MDGFCRNQGSFLQHIRVWQVVFCLAALLLGSSSSPAVETGNNVKSLDQLLDAVHQRVNDTRTVQCTFEQERNLSVFAQPIVFQGKMALVRPGKLRWENTAPIPSVLIFNGDEGIRCNDDAKPVRFALDKDPIMKMVAEQIWTWIDSNYQRLRDRYDISLSGPQAIQLMPRSGEFAGIITAVTIEFDAKSLQPRTILIRETSGDTTTIRFSDYRLNEPVKDLLFTTCYPDHDPS